MVSLPQSLTSRIQFFPPIDTRIFMWPLSFRSSNRFFNTNFSFLSLRGAYHSNHTFLWCNLCYHIWRELWSYGSACYDISLDHSPNIPLNIVFWHSQCMSSWWGRTRFMFLWPCIMSKVWRKNTNKMQQYRWFIVNSRCWLLTNVSTCFEHLFAHHQEKRPRITAYGVFAGSVGCGWLQLCGATL